MNAQSRYAAAMHRLQTILKFTLSEQGYDSMPGQVVPDDFEASPKHLRVGVESALASAEALGDLLVRKGVITSAELAEALTEQMTVRADAHELEVRARYPHLRFG